MKHLKSVMQFLNEAAPTPTPPAPATPPPAEEEDENKPAPPTPPATTPTTGEEPSGDAAAAPGSTDANAITPAPEAGADATDAAGAPGADAASGATPGGASPAGGAAPSADVSGGSSAGTPDASGLGPAPTSGGGGSSSGSSLGEPLSDEDTETPAKPQPEQPKTEKQEDYVPPVSKFNLVLMDKGAQWEQEYPNGGGVKEMEGFEVSWKDLNAWIDKNNLGYKKKDIAEYLMGDNDDLEDDVKSKLKGAFISKKLGDDTGKTEVEFDDDLTPYVQDINTIIVDL